MITSFSCVKPSSSPCFIKNKIQTFYQHLQGPTCTSPGLLFPAYLSLLSLLGPVSQPHWPLSYSRNMMNSTLLQNLRTFLLSVWTAPFILQASAQESVSQPLDLGGAPLSQISLSNILCIQLSSQSEVIVLFLFIHCPPSWMCTPSGQSPSLSRSPVNPQHFKLSLTYSWCSVNNLLN